MKKLKNLQLLLIFLVVCFNQKGLANTVFNDDFSTPVNTNYETDVRQLLENALGRKIDLQFNYELNEQFGNHIQVSYANQTLSINAANNRLKAVAAYTYLHELGFRFYGPENQWIYTPQLSLSDLNRNVSKEIPVKIARLFASQGFGSSKFNSAKEAKALWSRWNSRLRFYKLEDNLTLDHGSQRLNKKYKSEIISHPEWMPKNSAGKPSKFRNGTKLCYQNPGVVNLYKRYAKDELTKQMAKNNPPYYVNIEPTDGGGHCPCSSCRKGSYSNSVFELANEIANYVKTIHPEAFVNLYAYNQHALTPTFPLEKNILVLVIPDGFQNYKPGDQLFQDWIDTGNPLLYRGYLYYTRAGLDLPHRKSTNQYLNYVRKIKENDLYGYNFETSASFFSNGWIFYSMSELTFDDSFDQEKEWQLFLERMFGSSENELAKNFLLLTNGVNKIYISSIISFLEEQKSTTSDSNMLLRINDMLTYATYLKAYFKYNETKSKSDYDNLMQAIFADNGKLNIHSWGLYRVNNITNGNYKFSDDRPSLPNVTDLAYEEDDVEANEIIENSQLNYIPKNKNWYVPDESKQVITRNDFQFDFYASTDHLNPTFLIKADGFKSQLRGELILIKDGRVLEKKDIIYSNKFESYSFYLTSEGDYSIRSKTLKAEATIKVPKMPLAFVRKLNNLRQKSAEDYYFVAEHENLAFRISQKSGPFTVIELDSNKEIYKMEDPTNESILEEIGGFVPGKTYKVLAHKNSFGIQNQKLYLSKFPEAVWTIEKSK